MGLKVPATSLQWPQPSLPQSPSSSQALPSAIASPSSMRRSVSMCNIYGSSSFGPQQPSPKLYKSRSCENLRSRALPVRREEYEFDRDNQESDIGFHFYEEGINESCKNLQRGGVNLSRGDANFFLKNTKHDIPERGEILPPDVERAANSFGIPFSPRMIKHKKQQQENGLVENSARCSVKKAFSSMVFIIRELHSHTFLHMREILSYEDLQGIIGIVHKEMNDSFVWLFQKIFSQTPSLMIYLMILLANYGVYSMSNSAAIADKTISTMEEASSVVEEEPKFDSSVVKPFKLSSPSSSGKSSSIGGRNGGGGNCGAITSGTGGNDRSNGSNYYEIAPDVISSNGDLSETVKEDSVSKNLSSDEETSIWESMVHEDNSSEYFRTEFLYQIGLAREPENPLLLANYAQFLYVVARDYDRAEEYFKRAIKAEPKDAESFNKYANFLWFVRKDLWAAEETYVEAIDAEPENSYYRGSYAHFLWSTGGEDTCVL